jgi:hypothetical protein
MDGITPDERERTDRRLTMAAKLRNCVGSTRFGIEAHEAPVDEFPKQPSQPDGLGRMCKPHWKAYTAGLRQDALARKAAAEGPLAEAASSEPEPTGEMTAKAATNRTPRTRKPRTPSPKTDEVERAEALIAEVDAMPADEHVKRVGDADVQAALEARATARMPAD